jgi:hypothetical protein
MGMIDIFPPAELIVVHFITVIHIFINNNYVV